MRIWSHLQNLTARDCALALILISLATISGAWIFEYFGYLPCELCLKQRWAYYAGVPLAALSAIAAWRAPPRFAGALLALLAVLFIGSMIFLICVHIFQPIFVMLQNWNRAD